MIYFTADTHFWHTNIIQYCNRPFSCVEVMNDWMISCWNAVVHADDLVYHLGDVAFGGVEKQIDVLDQLAGNKIFILGNHDQRRILKAYGETYRKLRIQEKGFDIFLRHEPLSISKSIEYDLHLCGHVHEMKRFNNIVNVGVDQWGFRPITLEEIVDWCCQSEGSARRFLSRYERR